MNADRAKSIAVAVMFTCVSVLSFAADKDPAPAMPTELAIGVRTFFDFGPPFNYYDIFLVKSAGNKVEVERISLTPAGVDCLQPAKAEIAKGFIDESIEVLLNQVNPCAVPEKELHKEAQRCKKCLVFSGADVRMQVQCGGQQRLIQSSVLDRDWFDPNAGTPSNTSWTMKLVGRLNEAVGPGAMDKPIFAIEDGKMARTDAIPAETVKEIESGTYDALFASASDKPSELIRAAQIHVAAPSVEFVETNSVRPVAYELPKYPPIARAARIEGLVELSAKIDNNGNVDSVSLITGHPMLRGAAQAAVATWKFPTEAAGREVQLKIQFNLNCKLAEGVHGSPDAPSPKN